jgi:hypothetical protein
MAPDPQAEPVLPYSPSHTGRGSNVGYLGLSGVDFPQLWPLFVGVASGIGLGLHFFLGDGAGSAHWIAHTLASVAPAVLGYGYLRLLVQGRPPHFKADLVHAAARLRIDFTSPPVRSVALVPRIRVDGSDGAYGRVCERHPLARLRAR